MGMKRKTISLLIIATALVMLVSCTDVQSKRKVSFRIPQHPWEGVSGKRLWYTLRWTDGEAVNAIHIPQDERSVTLKVLPGRTVLAVAYPLSDMAPFGAAITPEDGKADVLMTPEDGTLADMLIDMNSKALGMLNYGLIRNKMLKKTNDIRKIEDVSVIKDIQNGMLSESSFKVSSCFDVGPFALSNGIWESEFIRDPSIVASDGMSNSVSLPVGVFRYLNTEDDMVLVLIVDRDGNFYSYQKRLGI